MKYLLFILGLCFFATAASANSPTKRLDAAAAAIVAANNQLALDIYHALPTEEPTCFSPIGLTTLLSTLVLSGKGDTVAEVERLLRVDLPAIEVLPAASSVDEALSLAEPKESYLFNLHSTLWVDRTIVLRADFKPLLGDAVDLKVIDFTLGDQATEAIGKEFGVAKDGAATLAAQSSKSNGTLNKDGKLLLTQRVELLDPWRRPFKKADTEIAAFHDALGGEPKISLMHETAKLKYLRAAAFQAVELPFQAHDLRLLILLPDQAADLPALEKNMTFAHLNRWIRELQIVRKVDVGLPKIKFANAFSAQDVLEKEGMRAAFSPSTADFSGMSTQTGLYISAILQKASFDINEAGAGDAPAVSAAVPDQEFSSAKPIIFRADHPFVFLIRDERSGAFLYMGRVSRLGSGTQTQ